MTGKKMIIAIDGHSSCGKSTFAKAIAQYMNYTYIDSGAMYRAVTFLSIENNIFEGSSVNSIELNKIIDGIKIEFRTDPGSGKSLTFVNGKDVEQQIRLIDVASKVSIISKYPEVREKLIALQRELGNGKGVVMDGRDIGTVVFPEAEIKIFLTADPKIRAERRYKELLAGNHKVTFEEILKNITERDYLDENRAESPLKRAEDAVLLDNSHMTPFDQMEWFKEHLNK